MTPEQLLQNAYHYHHAGKLAQAEAIYRQIVAQYPDNDGALHMLGVLGGQLGHTDAAIELIQRAIQKNPNIALYHTNLAKLLLDKARNDEAIAAARQALTLDASSGLHHYNLANALGAKGLSTEAAAECREAIRLQPTLLGAHQNLIYILESQGERQAAIAAGREAVRLLPGQPLSHVLLGNSLQLDFQFDAATQAYQEALRLEPANLQAMVNLGYGYKEMGRMNDAVTTYRAVVQHHPESAAAHSNLVYALHFLPESTPRSLFDEHRTWNQQHAEPLKKLIEPHKNDRTPTRRLRIGYVSPDFREHPVGRMLLPLLAHHNHQQFEVHLFSAVRAPDAFTEQLRSHADHWHGIASLNDAAVAAMIREKEIDLLVDLTMHMTGNRLLAFARKPAPVQLSYLAYCSTTGMDAIDYRVSDPHLDPQGGDEAVYSEKTVRLPETYWCYSEPAAAPEVNEPPAIAAGHITFGCFNNFCKVSPNTLDTWADLLQAVADSRLMLYAPPGDHRDRVTASFAARGIAPDRIEFHGLAPAAEYFRRYHSIDIALDPFPYAGGTTTCDALFMGVPVVTLAGQTAVGRGGVSILSNLGLREWVATSPDQYLQIARNLARDTAPLAHLRHTLRDRLRASPLMNAPRFTHHMESLYRRLWQNFCIRL